MKAWTIVAWTYEADMHCTTCAQKRFGIEPLHKDTAVDREGNTPKPVFADQREGDEHCGTCGTEI